MEQIHTRPGGRALCEELDINGVTWDGAALEHACLGWLDCLTDDCRWRTGPGADYPLYRPDGGSRRCRRGARYRVYAVKTVKGELWCQITPPPACALSGTVPPVWVNAAGSGHLAKPAA